MKFIPSLLQNARFMAEELLLITKRPSAGNIGNIAKTGLLVRDKNNQTETRILKYIGYMSALVIAALMLVNSVAVANDTANPPSVVATIRPIHSIASYIMQGVGKPKLLISSPQEPHHYSLKPSDKKLLLSADLLLWVSPRLEEFITDATSEPLINSMGLWLLPHIGTNVNADPHIWLNLNNATIIATKIANALTTIDSNNATTYQQNLTNFITLIDELKKTANEKFKAIKEHEFLLHYNGMEYLTTQFDFKVINIIQPNHDVAISPKQLLTAHKQLHEIKHSCVITDSSLNQKIIDNLIANTTANVATIDVLGWQMPAGPALYFMMMNTIFDNIDGCFKMFTAAN